MSISVGYVTGGTLNLRAQADRYSDRLASIPNDTDLVLLYNGTSTPGWYMTIFEMHEGFVMADYIHITETNEPYWKYLLGLTNLYNGCSSSLFVKNLQELLRDAPQNFYTGAIDGIFGDGTEAAVRAMQRAAGLDADGIVGPLTKAALVPEYV